MRSWARATAAFVITSIISSVAIAASPQINIAYGPANDDPDVVHARDVFVKSRALEEWRQFLAPLRLPTDITMRADACGDTRRAYSPETKTATICYEMIAQILKVVADQQSQAAKDPNDKSTADDFNDARVGTIVEALFHETAYLLFDVFSVPVWGRIEDAADRFSALVMLQFGEDAARTTILGTARFFAWSAKQWTGSDFALPSAPEAQRFYNFICIAYGADPKAFHALKANEVLPASRVDQCSSEYAQVRAAFDLRIMPFIDPDALVKARARSW